MEIFNFQAKNCVALAKYLRFLKIEASSIQKVEDIIYLPISFFKTHDILSSSKNPEIIFKSSGTGGEKSQHLVVNEIDYHQSVVLHFNHAFGDFKNYAHLALLPNYVAQGNSSLVNQVNYFIENTTYQAESDFFMDDFNALAMRLDALKNTPTVLWGVSFALLDFIEKRIIQHPDLIVIETGGMKGRRKEMVREEIQILLQKGFLGAKLSSEYGMTELFSQAYWKDNYFYTHPSFQVKIRSTNDPFHLVGHDKHGAINVIDLHNWQTCSFIETADLGISSPSGFKVLGRMDSAEIRGCSLLYEQ